MRSNLILIARRPQCTYNNARIKQRTQLHIFYVYCLSSDNSAKKDELVAESKNYKITSLLQIFLYCFKSKKNKLNNAIHVNNTNQKIPFFLQKKVLLSMCSCFRLLIPAFAADDLRVHKWRNKQKQSNKKTIYFTRFTLHTLQNIFGLLSFLRLIHKASLSKYWVFHTRFNGYKHKKILIFYLFVSRNIVLQTASRLFFVRIKIILSFRLFLFDCIVSHFYT